ncbi:hypothetical protein CKO51_13305 [Rhodopirellula sp. SM50]|nr:hypothetical protein CKO51_13305 [Rhodopirellula sp. SM50]
MKLSQIVWDSDYCAYYAEHWWLPPPLPGPDDCGESILGIPWLWYWLAIGCEGCDSEPDPFVLPTVIAIWNQSIKNNRREVPINNQFLEDYGLKPRSADRALKRLHDKSLIIYTIKNRKYNSVIILPTPVAAE